MYVLAYVQAGFGVNHADLGPKYTGSLVGISGSIGMLSAIMSPIAAGYILEITNSWNSIFKGEYKSETWLSRSLRLGRHDLADERVQ